MKAVVMAGGQGSRLRPLTSGRPKPMVPVVNKPVMAHVLELLKRHGITDVVVTVQYGASMIQDYFGNGQQMGLNISYVAEEVPLGTAGSVRNARSLLEGPFIVVSADALTDIDLRAIIGFHQQKKALATLALYRVPSPLEYGVIITDADGRIVRFLEKPSWGEVISDQVNTGIYVLQPEVLDLIPEGEPYDWSQQVFPRLLERGAPLFGYVAEGYWCDIGNHQEYMRASTDLLQGIVQLGELGRHIGGSIWTSGNVEIAPDAQLHGPIFLGDGVKIKGGVIIHGPVVVRDHTILDNWSRIERSIIWRNCYIGEAAELRGAIIGRHCSVKAKVGISEGVVIGDNCVIGEQAVVYPNVKIWPDKEVEAGATVKSSIIWGQKGRRVLFGRFGVTGVVNVDLTPEFAARLGAAFASTLPKGSAVIVNRDAHRSTRMLKRAMISGIPSAGVSVLDSRTMPLPVARYYTRVSHAVAGVHVRLSPHDQRVVDIRFMDGDGLNLDKAAEREIEKAFFREDFRRAYMDDIGTIDYASGVEERYGAGFLAALNCDAIRERRFKIVVDYAYAPNALVLPSLLDNLRVDVVPLNANLDESRMSMLRQEFEAELEQLGKIVGALGTDLGVRLDVGGEKIFLVDDRGRLLSDAVGCAAIADLSMRAAGGGVLAVPLDQPMIFEQIAARYGGRVVRTKTDSHALMRACVREEGVIMAGDGTGNFIFPAFQPAMDGLMATAKLLELLATQHIRLSDVVAGLPASFVARRQVDCPWEAKGKVMRRLSEQHKDAYVDTLDGIKIRLGDLVWVLIRPDPDRPICHIVAEGSSGAAAERIVDEYTRLLESLRE
jgi:mannose-1-phosphate guanylyltransferase/phosphomannomutase